MAISCVIRYLRILPSLVVTTIALVACGDGTSINRAPFIVSGQSIVSITVPENTETVNTQIEFSDPDGDRLTYTFGGIDSDELSISPINNGIRFNAPLDFENPRDSNGDNIYEIHIAASDGKLTTTVRLQISVEDVLGNRGFVFEPCVPVGVGEIYNTPPIYLGDINGDGFDDFSFGSLPHGDSDFRRSNFVFGTSKTIGERDVNGRQTLTQRGFGPQAGFLRSGAYAMAARSGSANLDQIDDVAITAGEDDKLLSSIAFGASRFNSVGGAILFGRLSGFGDYFGADRFFQHLDEVTPEHGVFFVSENGVVVSSIGNIGDLDGDGSDETLIRLHSGKNFILWGRRIFGDVLFDGYRYFNVDQPISDDFGFVVNFDDLDASLVSLTAIGDWNRDGLDDFAVVSTRLNAQDTKYQAELSIILGAPVLGEIGADGQRVLDLARDGEVIKRIYTDQFDSVVRLHISPKVGDFNNDGFHDLLIAEAHSDGVRNAYLLFGNDTPRFNIPLSQLKMPHGFVITPEESFSTANPLNNAVD